MSQWGLFSSKGTELSRRVANCGSGAEAAQSCKLLVCRYQDGYLGFSHQIPQSAIDRHHALLAHTQTQMMRPRQLLFGDIGLQCAFLVSIEEKDYQSLTREKLLSCWNKSEGEN